MTAVYIGLQRGGGIIGYLNRLVTRSRFGHALIAFGDDAFSADARKGWGWLRVSKIQVPTRWYGIEASPAQLAEMRRWCLQRAGWRYDWISVLKFTLPWRLFFPSREARRDRRKLFCSEGVYSCLLEGAAIRLLGEAYAWEVAPGHFRMASGLKRATPLTYRGPTI